MLSCPRGGTDERNHVPRRKRKVPFGEGRSCYRNRLVRAVASMPALTSLLAGYRGRVGKSAGKWRESKNGCALATRLAKVAGS